MAKKDEKLIKVLESLVKKSDSRKVARVARKIVYGMDFGKNTVEVKLSLN